MTIDYPDLSTLPAELHDAVIQHGSLNVYRMIAHSAGLAPGLPDNGRCCPASQFAARAVA